MTSSADLVASFFARIHPTEQDPSISKELARLGRQIRRETPQVIQELNLSGKSREVWPRINGIRQRRIEVSADGPVLQAYLKVFASKFAFALYREHLGYALPIGGGAFSRCFLNAGLAQKDADTFLAAMPIRGGLRQGSFRSDGQFFYRYNSDEKEIVASLAAFHSGLYIFSITTSRPEYYLKDWRCKGGSDSFASPGGIIGMLPTT